ncbi:MAG: 16S rRNA (guanine(966)-N(2))-methyltransferase RsmD [Pseudomonadota bacterium]|nr:16S rRNA (guanine(966)-N(2))-methyltransferase RsmD [Pseudomonadota bacterium]
MRIIGGKHRRRALLTPPDQEIRPTGDRLRETIFNLLAHAAWMERGLQGLTVLDAFCGTGALGLEALSRGVGRAVFMDISQSSLDLARRNARALGEEGACTFLQVDATRPPAPPVACDLVFLDPPYGKNLVPAALKALSENGWLAPHAVAVCETATTDPWQDVPGLVLKDTRIQGGIVVRFLVAAGASSA